MQGLTRKGSKTIQVRFQDAEIARLQAEAEEKHTTISAVIRERLFQYQVQRLQP